MKTSFVSFLILATSLTSNAQHSAIFSTEEGAIRGYDPVAYFKNADAVKGKKEFSYDHENATWYFSSQENLEIFKATPEKYLPQYGGYCAYGASDGDGHKAPTQPDAWTVINGKLYFNYNKKVQTLWLKDTAELIGKADFNWPKIKNQ